MRQWAFVTLFFTDFVPGHWGAPPFTFFVKGGLFFLTMLASEGKACPKLNDPGDSRTDYLPEGWIGKVRIRVGEFRMVENVEEFCS